MSKVIKPIETMWKGYRFRSRLEARWAVVFESLGLNWEYEQEGLCLPDGTWYLPDFYLPDQATYIEVKPKMDVDPEEIYCTRLDRVIPPELKKISQFSGLTTEAHRQRKGHWTDRNGWILIAGNPHPGEYLAFTNTGYGCLFRAHRLIDGEYLPSPRLRVYSYVLDDSKVFHYGKERQDVVTALANGRAARFEFGEQP